MLFAVQILGAILFCGAQFLRSLHDVHGVILVQFILATVFVGFNFILSLGAHRAQPGRRTVQALITYSVWLVASSLTVIGVATNQDYQWSIQDNSTLLIAVGLAAATLAFGRSQSLSLRDPMILAFLAIASKAIPQLLLAWKILEEGGSGLPGITVLVGHCTILLRLGQIYFMIRESGWERNRFWLAISEGSAELTWLVATAAWLVMI